jgi:uncharacterized protein (TIGR02145 family)
MMNKFNIIILLVILYSTSLPQLKELKVTPLPEIQINISSSPSNPKIFIDGKFLGIEPQIKVTPGVHLLRLEKDGYKTLEKSIEVTETNTYFWESMDLIENIAVTISSEPDKASLFIDNTSKGETPQRVLLYPGKYKLKLTKAGFRDFEKVIEISDTGKSNYSFPLMLIGGELELNITPSDCDIYINRVKQIHQKQYNLSPGKYNIQLSKEGYYDKDTIIDIEPGKKISKAFNLEAKKVIAPVPKVVLINENKVKEIKPVEIKPIAIKPIENKPVEIKPIENKPIAIKPIENKPVEIKPIENKPIANTTPPQKLSLDTITYEGKTYHKVKIGTQYWLKENLDVGTMIKGSENQTNNSVIEKYCYDDKIENCAKYGGLYQWEEAMQYVTTPGTKGICPTAWHIPTLAELQTLAATVSNDGNALKGIDQGSESGTGTNTSGFSALLAGYRNYITEFTNLGNFTYFWSSTEKDESYTQSMSLSSDDSNIKFTTYKKKVGLSIRCLKD